MQSAILSVLIRAQQLRDDSSSSREDEDEDRQLRQQPRTTVALEVCLVAPRPGFALVPCGHARFCEACPMRVSVMDGGCPVSRADITIPMRIFLDDRLCRSTMATFILIIATFAYDKYTCAVDGVSS